MAIGETRQDVMERERREARDRDRDRGRGGFEPESIARERERRRREGRGWGPAPVPLPPPPPPLLEREYPHLPGFGWEWPGPEVDWERYAEVPMQVMMGERPWETLGEPMPEELLLPEEVTLPPTRPPAREWGMAGWEGVTPRGPRAYPTGLEMALTGNIGRWGQEYSAKTPIVLPAGFEEEIPPAEQFTDEQLLQMGFKNRAAYQEYAADISWQRYDWAKTIAYDETLFNPETGQQLTWHEAARLARTNPEMPVVDVFAFGGGDTIEVDMTLNDLFTGRPQEELEDLFKGEVEAIETKVEEQIEALLEERKAKILDSDMSYVEKLKAVLELYGETSGRPDVYRKLNAEVLASLSPEEREQREREKTEGGPRGLPVPPPPERKAPVAAKVDVGALRGTLEPYGIRVLDTWPYLELTEEQLRQLPPDVFETMGKYLRERGVALGDAIVRPETRGAPPMRGRWAIPRQW